MAISNENSRRSNPVAHGPAGFRCLVSAVAIALQVVIFACLRLMDQPPQKHLLLWCWVIALDVGIVFGVYGLTSARNWSERFLAISLLCFQSLMFWFLFLIAIALYVRTHGAVSIH